MAGQGLTAVLFDWDFTLAYSISPDITHSEKLTILFQKYGVQCDNEAVSNAIRSLQKDIVNKKTTGKLYPQKRSDIIHNYRKMLDRLGHPDTSYEFAYQVYSGYALLPHYLYPDVLPTLTKLLDCNLQLGVLSNHSRTARQLMEEFLDGYIDPSTIILSEEAGTHKPSKTIFQKAASRIRTPPENCVYVGDNLTVDAIGAVESGEFARGVWLDRNNVGPMAKLPKNVYRIVSLSELDALVC